MAGRHCDLSRGDKTMVTARMEQLVWLLGGEEGGAAGHPLPLSHPLGGKGVEASERPSPLPPLPPLLLEDHDVELSGQVRPGSCKGSEGEHDHPFYLTVFAGQLGGSEK